MCSSVAAVYPSSSPSSSSIGDVHLEEPSTPGRSTHPEHSKHTDTKKTNHFKVKRSASEPGLQCSLPQKETKVNAMRRGSDNPQHHSSLTTSSSESTIDTSTSSSSLDLDSSGSSSILSPSTKKSQRRRSSVQFGSLTIRSYEVQLGDNPSCSNGAPVSIGWRYNELNPICIEKYEAWMEDKRRSRHEFHLPRSQRESILLDYGYSRNQMTQATKEVAKIKKQRRASLKTTPITRLQETSWSFIDMKVMKRRSSC